MTETSEKKADMFVSLTQEEFDRLEPVSAKEIEQALDQWRPDRCHKRHYRSRLRLMS